MPVRLGYVQIGVTDLQASRRFYVDVLGCEPDEAASAHGVPVLRVPGGATLLLYPVEERAPSAYPDGTGPVLIFVVDDLDAVHARWSAAGVRFRRIAWSEEATGIAACPFGRFVAFEDPDGTVHEVLQPWRAGVGRDERPPGAA